MTDIEKWKKIVISLPEQIFFDVIRNYLGDVKTPFNKHSLIEELASFFRRDRNAEKILSLIDRNDAAVLTAMKLLGPVRIKNLYRIFSDKKSYYDFCLHLQNLEERMLVCTDENSGEYPMLIISPLFEDLLNERIINPSVIVPPLEKGSAVTQENSLWLSDSLLFAVYSFLLRKGQILKLDGNFRKKVTEELKVIFPDQLSFDPESKVDIIRLIFRRLGLVRQDGDFFKPVVERWKELSELTPEGRLYLCSGAAFSRDYRLFAPVVNAIAKTLCAAGRAFSEKSLIKIIDLVMLKNSVSHEGGGRAVLETLCSLGYVIRDGESFFPNLAYPGIDEQAVSGTGSSQGSGEAAAEQPSSGMRKFILQPNFDIHVSRDIPFADGIMLAVTADVKRYSEIVSFSLSRESFLRSLESGYDSRAIADLFVRLGGLPVPQNVMFSLESWEKEYRGLTFYSGIVLVADEKKRNIIDNSGHFTSGLCKKLSDNVYLVNQKNINALFEAFRKAGIDNIPSPGSIVPGYFEIEESKESFSRFREDLEPGRSIVPLEIDYSLKYNPAPEKVDPDSPGIREKIGNSHFTPEQKEVLAGRIERRLILFPEQISKGTARYEKTEARGLDYNGKLRIAEEVAGNSSYLVEVVESNADGEPVTRLIRAERLEKDGNNVFLRGILLQDDSEAVISISKASLIRKIRTSLFVK